MFSSPSARAALAAATIAIAAVAAVIFHLIVFSLF
jgi:hypothetical protein